MPMDTAAPQHAQRTDLIIRTARLAGRLLLENGNFIGLYFESKFDDDEN